MRSKVGASIMKTTLSFVAVTVAARTFPVFAVCVCVCARARACV